MLSKDASTSPHQSPFGACRTAASSETAVPSADPRNARTLLAVRNRPALELPDVDDSSVVSSLSRWSFSGFGDCGGGLGCAGFIGARRGGRLGSGVGSGIDWPAAASRGGSLRIVNFGC